MRLSFLYVCMVLTGLSAVFTSCKQSPTVAERFEESEALTELNEDTLIAHVRRRLSSQDELFPCSRHFAWLDLLRVHYSISEYKKLMVLRWTTASWDSLLSLIEESEKQGLDRRYYAYQELKDCLDSLHRYPKAEIPYALMADLELWGSHALLSLWHDLRWGRLDPVKLYGRYYNIPFEQSSPEEMLSVFLSDNPFNLVRSSFLIDEESIQMGLLLDSLKKRQWESSAPEPIDFGKKKRIDPGTRFEQFPALFRRMKYMGWIGSSDTLSADSLFYPKSFKAAMVRFQQSLALSDDGIIGGNTMEALNYTLSDYMLDVQANFERKRWVKRLMTRPMIWVNIPDYRLKLFYADSTRNMKVCIGEARSYQYDYLLREFATGRSKSKPSNHETPQVYSEVNHMVLNPTWTVPVSIVKNEMLVKIRRDPSYLSRNHYQVIDRNGKVLDPHKINWKQTAAATYTIRQTPGPHNALGQIKFMFLNPFSVYMHDTPNQAAFGLSARDVSHGCVRLEKPLEMAEFLCLVNPGTDYDDIRIILGYSPLSAGRLKNFDPYDTTAKIRASSDTKVVHLKNKVPVMFDYRTIFSDEKGKLQRRFDTYRKQSVLMEALKEI